MTLLVLGINHKTASVAVREKVAFSEEKRQHLPYNKFTNKIWQKVQVILSTCNRTEIYLHHRQISAQECKAKESELYKLFVTFITFSR